jgi:multiple antibiotic resistance protein
MVRPVSHGDGVISEPLALDVHFAATAFATAFTIIDPVGMIPLTLAATVGTEPHARQRIVNQAVLVAAFIILLMGLVGRSLLGYLGITLPAFTIAGGILLFLIATDMLFARRTGTKQTAEEEREAAVNDNPAVFPLAVPMLAGPGTIATVLLLGSMTRGAPEDIAIVVAAYGTALAVTWACMSLATTLQRVVGNTGVHVVTRLLGIILAALAVQFVINGLSGTPLVHPG